MGFFSDLARSLYDFPGLGNEISRRSAWRVFGTFLLASVVYGVVTGFWYGGAAVDFLRIVGREFKSKLPAISIENGKLSSPVKQPYILTEQDIGDSFFQDFAQLVHDRFHLSVPMNKSAILGYLNSDGNQAAHLFCAVLDTTGTYRKQIDPATCTVSMVADADMFVVTAPERSGSQRVQQYKFAEGENRQPVHFNPDQINLDVVTNRIAGPLKGWFAVMSVVFTLFRFLLKALLVAILGLIINAAMGKGFSFGRLFALGVYALVPVVVFGIIKVVAMPYPGILLFLIYLVYGLVPVFIAEPAESAPARSAS